MNDSAQRYRGLGGSGSAYVASLLAQGRDPLSPAVVDGPRVTLIVSPEVSLAQKVYDDLKFFFGSTAVEVHAFFPWEVLPFDALSPAGEVSAARLYSLSRLLHAEKAVVVTTPAAMMQRVISPECLESGTFEVSQGEALSRDTFIQKLEQAGFVRANLVEECGQMAVRGAVVDLFPPGVSLPVRVELFGDVVESVRSFDPASQRSVGNLKRLKIVPVRELFIDSLAPALSALKARASELELPLQSIKPIEEALRTGSLWPGLEHLTPLFTSALSSAWDYIAQDALLVSLDEQSIGACADTYAEIINERAKKAFSEGRLYPEPSTAYASADSFFESLNSRTNVFCEGLDVLGQESEKLHIYSNERLSASLQASKRSERPFSPLADEIRSRLRDNWAVGIVVSTVQRGRRVADLLAGYDIYSLETKEGFTEWLDARQRTPTASVTILHGLLSEGLQVPNERFLLILETELFPEIVQRRPASTAKSVKRFISSISQLKEDDFVVHVDHGVGLYRGLRQVEVDGKPSDFLHLEYFDGDKLFLPVENIGKVQKYIGAEGKQPALNRLGTKTWEKTKRKVEQNVAALAGQLVSLYAQREVSEGYSFGEPDTADLEFADLFEFEATDDQTKAIEEVLSDMAAPAPMDRLVCGDVGFGKTEVALRAAFKAVSAGKQVAVLVPTTILADQHFLTFRERFSGQAVEIACVSRFFPSAENKKTLERLAEGKVDIIIGTHRLLQRDVEFRDLGLLVIDEEHRFGVAHKEKLKRFRKEVDVLTLTATPIPRTLHMSMVGIRNLSLIETAPCDRQVIRTYVSTYAESIVREAVMRELGRGGQVFYLYNRVQNIQPIADEVAELVPEARVAVAHGQMKEKELENVMHRFVNHEIDVLVCTTIIESGLDISNANTMVVRNADMFGLAQLYQLRGRVGRSARRAYAYLLIGDPQKLGADARKRLKVLQSLDDLGQGFRLALQDMEIRGAGNLLGKDQSGQVNLIGYELFSRILKEAVEAHRRTRGGEEEEVPLPDIDPEVNIGFPAHIPAFFIPDVAERLLLYQRLVDMKDGGEASEILEEIHDRFGTPPPEVHILMELMVFRALLRRAFITSATLRGKRLRLAFHEKANIDPEKVLTLMKESSGGIRLSPSMALSVDPIPINVEKPEDLTEYLNALLLRIST